MKPLFTKSDLDSAGSRRILLCECLNCHKPFGKPKHRIQQAIKESKMYFCSTKCMGLYRVVTVKCAHCNKEHAKRKGQISKNKNCFCSRSCAATYNNTHKKYGTRRSKMEAYLEEQIRLHYPDLELLCNDKVAINSELDFYFPTMKLAIELNGIFHYEPIYGEEKLKQIQNNDDRKFLLCQRSNISLAIIDSSSCKHLTQSQKEKYWSITQSIINQHIISQTI